MKKAWLLLLIFLLSVSMFGCMSGASKTQVKKAPQHASKANQQNTSNVYTNTRYGFTFSLPKLKSANFEGLELIRPLYYIEEEYIEKFTSGSGIWPLNCACMVAAEKTANKRYEIKALIKELKKTFNNVDKHIMSSTQNVHMDCILGWQKDGKKYSYLDYYDEY